MIDLGEWRAPTRQELRDAQQMAHDVNGAFWEHLTEAQKRGWILKVRWARLKYWTKK